MGKTIFLKMFTQIFKTIKRYHLTPIHGPIFDYWLLRGLVGVVAFIFPFLVPISTGHFFDLPSISHSYHHTPGIEFFAGLLFFVGAFLTAYKGHTKLENIASTIGGICAICIAVFPTDKCIDVFSIPGIIHMITAVGLFIIIAYFSLVPFLIGAIDKLKDAKKANLPSKGINRRVWIYGICGAIIVITLVTYAIFAIFYEDFAQEHRLLFWAEFIALFVFGISWSVSSKRIPGFI